MTELAQLKDAEPANWLTKLTTRCPLKLLFRFWLITMAAVLVTALIKAGGDSASSHAWIALFSFCFPASLVATVLTLPVLHFVELVRPGVAIPEWMNSATLWSLCVLCGLAQWKVLFWWERRLQTDDHATVNTLLLKAAVLYPWISFPLLLLTANGIPSAAQQALFTFVFPGCVVAAALFYPWKQQSPGWKALTAFAVWFAILGLCHHIATVVIWGAT
jgi:hypothetical protein